MKSVFWVLAATLLLAGPATAQQVVLPSSQSSTGAAVPVSTINPLPAAVYTNTTSGYVLTSNGSGPATFQAGGGGGPPSGSAGGDLGGTYPNPTVTSVSHVTSGTLPVANGGTGVTSAQPNGSFVGLNPISGALAEYPMTEGTGTVVNDISGNSNTANFCASAPTWSTYGVVFTQNNCIQTPIKTWLTAIVHYCTAPLPQSGSVYPTYMAFLGTTDALVVMSGTTSASTFVSALPSIYDYVSGGWKTTSSTIGKICGTAAISLAASDHVYLNGVESAYSNQNSSASHVTTATTGYTIGTGNTGFAQAWIGTIDYAVFYSTALSAAQINQLSAYVNNKVTSRIGFPNYPVTPASNITASTPQVYCAGDSLTFAQGSSGTWCTPTYMPTTLTYTDNNWGVGTDSANGELTASLGRWISNMNPKANNKCLIWYGTNDQAVDSFTAAQTWTALQKLAFDAKTNGCTPIVSTMISRSGQDTAKNALNALIRSGWRNTSFAALNDIAAMPGLGADGAYANPTVTCFQGDGIHLTGVGAGTCYNSLSGYSVVGIQAGKTINILDGATSANPTITTSNAYTQAIGDNFILQTPTTAATNILPDCTGLTGIQRVINNGSGTYAITVQTSASQTITGSATIPANAQGQFTCLLTGPTTGGNYWLRTQ